MTFSLPASRLPPSRGFTLIEVLVAVTLLGLIMVLAYQGLRTGAHSAAQGEATIERVNRLRLAQEFVRAQLSRAQPMPFDQDDTLGQVVFEGGPESLQFAGPMPGYLSSGGPYIQSLVLDRGEDGLDLVFAHRVLQYGPDADRPRNENDEPKPVTLLGGIDEAKFSYLEPPETQDGEPEWVNEWRELDRLPLMIRVELTMREDARIRWPTLLVSPKVDSAARGGGQQIPFGPLPPGQGDKR